MNLEATRRGMALQQFLDDEPLLRHNQFRNLKEGQIKPILKSWTRDQKFRLTELMMLPEPYKNWGIQMVKQMGRPFFFKMNQEWTPPQKWVEAYGEEWTKAHRKSLKIEMPQDQNQRSYEEVEGVFSRGGKIAIQILNHFGECSSNVVMRGRVLEISEDEFQQAQAQAWKATAAERQAQAQAEQEEKARRDAEEEAFILARAKQILAKKEAEKSLGVPKIETKPKAKAKKTKA